MKKNWWKAHKRNKVAGRKLVYAAVMLIVMLSYFVLRLGCRYEWINELTMTVIAIVTIIAFWIEYHENKLLNEAQFINDLNQQFIGDINMTSIEWELEKFYDKYAKGILTDKDILNFEEKFTLEKPERQQLVNYLVHLEGVITLISSGVVSLSAVEDLMSYRYFIAVNNPVVQKLELIQYADYYRGCIGVYEKWVNRMKKKGITIPMCEQYDLLVRLEDK